MTDPFTGHFRLDPDTLNYEHGRPGRRAEYIISTTPEGDGLMFDLDCDGADGKLIKVCCGGPTDGVPRPLPANVSPDPSLQLVLSRETPGMVERVLLKDGKLVDRWTRELCADGESILITQHVTAADGRQLKNTGVYRRVK